jgi:hypothetical protein
MDVERRKLAYSLAINFATRIPGAIGVLFFLPLLRFGLGTADYASLLGASALGMASAFLSGGYGTVARRIVGEAYAARNPKHEANGFVSSVVSSAAGLLIATTIILIYCQATGANTTYFIVAMLPPITAFFNVIDNTRAAYNEHYVTATWLIVWQVVAYSIGFLVPYTRHHLIVSALLLGSPYMLASITAGVMLLWRRPYLLAGGAQLAGRVMREGTTFAVADGLLIASLSFAVTWVETSGRAETAAWFGTLVRLFQIFLVPIILLLLPLSSYIRIVWNERDAAQKKSLARTTLLLGLSYGGVVAIGLMLASKLYIGGVLKLNPGISAIEILPCFLLFGAIVAFRSYSSIAYQVLDNPMHLSWWTTVAVVTAVAISVTSSVMIDTIEAISLYGLIAGLLLIAVLVWNVSRFTRTGISNA